MNFCSAEICRRVGWVQTLSGHLLPLHLWRLRLGKHRSAYDQVANVNCFITTVTFHKIILTLIIRVSLVGTVVPVEPLQRVPCGDSHSFCKTCLKKHVETKIKLSLVQNIDSHVYNGGTRTHLLLQLVFPGCDMSSIGGVLSQIRGPFRTIAFCQWLPPSLCPSLHTRTFTHIHTHT